MTITHRMSRTPTYKTWLKMKERCGNPNADRYKWYGGKGIAVCARWLDSFENFLADMGPRPAGMTIDREDGSRGYEPANCRWATKIEQARNQGNTIFVELDGERVTLREACERHGLNFHTVYFRMELGHPFDVAIKSGYLHRVRTDDKLREYAELRQAGKTHRELALHFGVAAGTLEHWSKRARAMGLSLSGIFRTGRAAA